MNHEFLDLKLFGPQELAPLIKKYRKLKEATKPIAVVKTRWPEMQ
jgi:hypothetical protein